MIESNFSEADGGDGGDEFGSDDFDSDDFRDDFHGNNTSGKEHGNDAIAYLGDLPESFGDEDREITSRLFSGLEDKISPEAGQELLSRYVEWAEEIKEAEQQGVGVEQQGAAWADAYDGMAEHDDSEKEEAVTNLRRAWGHKYEANIESLQTALASQPFGAALLDARYPDGKAIFNDPGFLTWLLGRTKGANMSQQGGQPPEKRDALENELEKIQQKIGTQEYIKSDRMQSRYRELLRLTGKAD